MLALATSCRSAAEHRRAADEVALRIIASGQQQALGRTENFTVERPSDTLRQRLIDSQLLPVAMLTRVNPTPVVSAQTAPHTLTLIEALGLGASSSREYQRRKEDVFRAALALDLARDAYRLTFSGLVSGLYSEDTSAEPRVAGFSETGDVGVTKVLKNGASFATSLGIDLVKLLTGERPSALGLVADASISIPLLRGAGRAIASEPLTQAERDIVYAIEEFERFKQTFAVRIASEYFAALAQLDQVENAEESYRRLLFVSKRSRELANAGRLPEVQVDQARQDELRARDRVNAARESSDTQLDSLKLTLGLPADSRVIVDRAELESLTTATREMLTSIASRESAVAEEAGSAPTIPPRGPLELDEASAIALALERRLDLKVALGSLEDARRAERIAADALRAGLELSGSAAIGEGRSLGSADQPDSKLRFDRGFYAAGLDLDLPWERTAERNAYRNALIEVERRLRDVEELEDQIKSDVRFSLRVLRRAGESYRIQIVATALAEQRVNSTKMFRQAGRAETRDELEAQEDWLAAQDAQTAALIDYRVGELELQRDLGVLHVGGDGRWEEFQPVAATDAKVGSDE
ncbi:MAG: TolC family protein [Planctomycetota bacterium]